MQILTEEEHDNYVHLCGKTGREVKDLLCIACDRLIDCLESHAIVGVDAESRLGRRNLSTWNGIIEAYGLLAAEDLNRIRIKVDKL